MEKKTTQTVRAPKKKIVAKDVIQYVLPLGGTGWVVKNSSLKTLLSEKIIEIKVV